MDINKTNNQKTVVRSNNTSNTTSETTTTTITKEIAIEVRKPQPIKVFLKGFFSLVLLAAAFYLPYLATSLIFTEYTVNSLNTYSSISTPTVSTYFSAYLTNLSSDNNLLLQIGLILVGIVVLSFLYALISSKIQQNAVKNGKAYFVGQLILGLIIVFISAGIGFRESFYISQTRFANEMTEIIDQSNRYESFPEAISDPKQIVAEITKFEQNENELPPLVLGDLTKNNIDQDVFLALTKRLTNRGTYYTTDIAKTFIDRPETDLSNDEIFFLNNKLYVNYPSIEIFGKIDSALAYSIYNDYFKTNEKLPDPKIQNITYDEFKIERRKEITSQMTEIKKLIKLINSAITEYSNFINVTQRYYNSTHDAYYLTQINEMRAEIRYFEQEKSAAQEMLEDLNDKMQEDPAEVGLFYRPDKIKIVLGQGKNDTPSCYIDTLVHEYLHYSSSYKKKDVQVLPTGYEEALTSFLSEALMKEYFSETACSIAYESSYSIISRMMEDIPISDFVKAYKNKDEAYLKKIIDDTYGTGFYTKTLFRMNYLTLFSGDETSNTYYKELIQEIDAARE